VDSANSRASLEKAYREKTLDNFQECFDAGVALSRELSTQALLMRHMIGMSDARGDDEGSAYAQVKISDLMHDREFYFKNAAMVISMLVEMRGADESKLAAELSATAMDVLTQPLQPMSFADLREKITISTDELWKNFNRFGKVSVSFAELNLAYLAQRMIFWRNHYRWKKKMRNSSMRPYKCNSRHKFWAVSKPNCYASKNVRPQASTRPIINLKPLGYTAG